MSTTDKASPSAVAPSALQATPSTSRFVEVAGLKLHYLDYGSAGRPPLVCLHGGAAHAHWYDFVASAFTPEHRVLAFDGRGHGDSAWSVPPDYTYERFAADLAEAAEKLDLRDFTLVGHSVGGVVSLLYAAKYSGRVRRLIIIDSNLTTSSERVAAFRKMALRPADTYASREELITSYKINPNETTASPEVIRHLASHDARQIADGRWQQKFDRNFYSDREWNHGFDCWNDVKIPVLLIKADLSARITPEIIAEVKARCPQVRITTVPDSNHHVMLDNPDAFVGAIREFIEATR